MSKNRPGNRPVVVMALLTGLGLLPAAARAEINMADSVEWMSADADLVVRGRVIQVVAHSGKGHATWSRVTLQVLETLKGRGQPVVRLMVPAYHGNTLRAFQRGRVELLAYLVNSGRRVQDDRRYALAPFALRRGAGGVGDLVALTGPRPGRLFNMAYQIVAGRGPILTAARAAAKVKGARGRHRIDLPFNSPAFKALWGGSAVWLYVPVDARLEGLGVRWIADRAFRRRLEGVKVLTHFKSAANIRRLRGLLGDPGYWTESTGQPGAPRTRAYAVREAAWKALTAWKVPVRRPVIRVPAP